MSLLSILLLPAVAAAQDGTGRIYVRRIEFHGVSEIDDEVLRREMSQLEGAFLNTVALAASRRRLVRLPFVESAQVRLRPVDNQPDIVDVVITIVEAPSRRYGGGGAYSEAQGVSLHAYYIDENLLGTGQRLSFVVDGSELRGMAEAAHTDPYARDGGVSRTVALSARRIDRLARDASRLDAELDSARVEYSYRIGQESRSAAGAAPRTEPPEADCCRSPTLPSFTAFGAAACCASLRLGLDVRNIELEAGVAASEQLTRWIAEHDDPGAGGDSRSADVSEVDVLFELRYDTREPSIFPERGLEQTLSLRAALPGSDIEYYVVDYEVARYWPIGRRWTASIRGLLGFGAEYGGDAASMPPYLNWFAGGPRTVRGYRETGLGPKDSRGNPYGGNLLVVGQSELMTPWPPQWRERARIGFFFDVGNVFSTEDTVFTDGAGQPLRYRFDWSELRSSFGVAFDVLIPLGALRISYGVPMNAEEDANPFLDDDVERFQVSISVDR